MLQLYLSGGCSVTVCINSVMSGFSQDIIVCGSAGYLALANDTLRGKKNGASKEQLLHAEAMAESADVAQSGLPVPHALGMDRMIMELKKVFHSGGGAGGEGGAASFSDGLYVQAVMEALRRSSETRQWRKVEMLDEEGGGSHVV